MNKETTNMKMEIRAIANYQALIISKYYINIMLILITLYLGFFRYNLSSLYILIVLNLFPNALAVGIKDYVKKTGNRILTTITTDNSFQFNILKQKYKYTRLKYVSNSITYLITLILISLWQYRNYIDQYLRYEVKNLPLLVLMTGLFLRLLGILYYRLKLSYDLYQNKV
jgi:hypothetical protein